MIRIEELKLDLKYTEAQLKQRILDTLKLDETELVRYHLVRRAVDARKKPEVFYVLTVDVEVRREKPVLSRVRTSKVHRAETPRYHFPKSGTEPLRHRPVVIGSGPCGLLCTYELALHGYRPILLERGSAVEERREKVERFWATGELDRNNNAQFGEGGAGTFSDGKLTSGTKDPAGRKRELFELFVKMGAPESILFDALPHIGTDGLLGVLQNLRQRIRELGGTVCFQSQVTELFTENHRLTGLVINGEEALDAEVAILCIGHSARDTFRMLEKKGLSMEAKPFAAGFRIEHPQSFIDKAQYGFSDRALLPAAPYKLTASAPDGRGVYSFCMCPGGYVVNASSEPGRLAVNGMSYAARDGQNANSAIVVSVTPQDFPEQGALAGIEFQEELEKKAFALAGGRIPQQLYGDFLAGRLSPEYGDFSSETRGEAAFGELHTLFPETIKNAWCFGMERFGERIPHFTRADAILSGVESRTSSPVHILRDERGESSIRGLYPAGEGAGYAGGIVSAAMDGIRAAEQIASRYKMEA